MKIVCDKNMPFVQEAFSTLGDVSLIDGREISAADVKDADMLIIRSTTRVDGRLLEGSRVRFCGSGVIGTDHLDIAYLRSAGIQLVTSPGCNAVSVGNYVVAALLWLSGEYGFKLKDKSLGVVGVGNVGSQVCRFARALGMRVLANDPPRQRNSDDIEARSFVNIERILGESDIISLHVPLSKEGIDSTFHLIGSERFAVAREGVMLINAARGAVIDNQALCDALHAGRISHAVVDCWEGEPCYRDDLLRLVDIGTPHIAGHSFEGKVNGTAMTYRGACAFLGVEPEYPFTLPEPPVPLIDTSAFQRRDEDVLRELVLRVYDIRGDSERLRCATVSDNAQRVKVFNAQRASYPIRRQFESTKVRIEDASSALLEKAGALGFQL
jgi:erythronate-4-phosphate dehydrogenase